MSKLHVDALRTSRNHAGPNWPAQMTSIRAGTVSARPNNQNNANCPIIALHASARMTTLPRGGMDAASTARAPNARAVGAAGENKANGSQTGNPSTSPNLSSNANRTQRTVGDNTQMAARAHWMLFRDVVILH